MRRPGSPFARYAPLFTLQSLDNRAEKFTDTGGQSHRQRAPECHSGRAAQNIGTARSRPDRTQKSEKTQRRSGHNRDERAGGRYDDHEHGIAAPKENDAAEVSAACTGRAVVISEIPSSSRAWALKASFAINCWATFRATA